MWVSRISYLLTLVIVKISILLLYRSVFPGPRFNIVTYILGAIVLGWGIALTLVEIFLCVPVQAYWNTKIPAACLNVKNVSLGITIINLFTDIAVLCLPIPNVWRLQLSLRTKLGILTIFLLGSL